MTEDAKDTLTGATIPEGVYKAYIVYFDKKERAYREGTFANRTNLMIWLGRFAESERAEEEEM